MKWKKGQLTVIIIISILMIIIFGAVTYITGKAQEEKGELAVQQQILSQAKIRPIQEYVMSCLDLAAKAALETMGKQGGNLYLSQGGLIPDQSKVDLGKTFITYEGHDIPYAINRPRGHVANVYFSETPKYPWNSFPWVGEPERKQLEGFFGFNYLNKLLKPYTNSVQEQMEVYVKNNVLACADWSSFELQNLQIDSGEPIVNISILDRSVLYEMKYPISITDLSTGATDDLLDFAISYDVRLKTIFEFLEWMSDNDVSDLTFQIKDVSIKDVRTDVIRNVEGGHDDIVVIRDAQSTILGQPFEFRFAVQNRAPALGRLNSSDFILCELFGESGPTITLNATNALRFDNPPDPCSGELIIPIEAWDPDDDPINITFNIYPQPGWVTSYTLELNELPVEPFNFTITVRASDGEFEDEQIYQLRTVRELPP